jgi:hypothetical protein
MDLLQRSQLHYAADCPQLGVRARLLDDQFTSAGVCSHQPFGIFAHHLVFDVLQGSEDSVDRYLGLLPCHASLSSSSHHAFGGCANLFRSCILYSTIRPTWNHEQIGFNVIAGIGQSGPLTLLVACVQFTSPHAFLSTATGLAFSARAIGGAFGSAVIDAIVNGRLASNYAPAVSAAATDAGLPADSVPALLAALAKGDIGDPSVTGATDAVWAAATTESHWQYAYAYRVAWASVIPFVVLALVAVICMRGVKELMTEKVEATVEHVDRSAVEEKSAA